ncbi:hypothetical protein D7X94_14615 [Acutalibacter sp. 1XD8-33]|uniref:hypothetical protein n=1 Tax=Acutalibacter sp. 1XD8-33 TaxID=2320081 RepID=UPI000E9FFF5E|nr:hypothetical protein [Acutalibacter sp. 1XD8-33]RKJ38900.1 hypothetical protein D7X94_14615 [Acutalibacter sp. 1XD8-33]
MMYPFLTLDDGTEIVHSEMLPDSRVKVYMERADEKIGFLHATCFLPEYEWEEISVFSESEIERFQDVIRSTAHLILQFSQAGGFDHAAFFKLSP